MGSISAANAEFSFDAFKDLKVHHANDNIFYSPLSIIAALAMVYLGARGNTEYQMEKVSYINGYKLLLISFNTATDYPFTSLGLSPVEGRKSHSHIWHWVQSCLEKRMAFQTMRFGPGAEFSLTIAFPHEGQEQPLASIKKEQSWRMVEAGILLQFILSHTPGSFQVERTTCNIQKMQHSANNSHSYRYNTVRLQLVYRLSTIN